MVTSALLEKTRSINKLLQKTTDGYVDYKEISEVLRDNIKANVYIVDQEGVILGHSLVDEFECEIMISEVLQKGYFPESYNSFLLKDDDLRYNLQQKSNYCVFMEDSECIFTNKVVTVLPILGGGTRLGTLLLARFSEQFTEEDLLLAERGATVIGVEILREKTEKSEGEARRKAVVKLAVGTLSFSEMEAMQQVFKEIEGDSGLLVASKIADELGITRSVIVNALRKLESAGVIESRSLGMKGTYIKVLNPYLFQQL